MYAYVHVYSVLYTWMHTYVYIVCYMHVCIHSPAVFCTFCLVSATSESFSSFVCVCMCVRVCVCVRACVYVCVRVCVCMCVFPSLSFCSNFYGAITNDVLCGGSLSHPLQTTLSNIRVKFPHKSINQSAAMHVAYYLKANNPQHTAEERGTYANTMQCNAM